MAEGEIKRLTREEVQTILEENARLKADPEKVRARHRRSYARLKERAAADPEFAARLKAKQKAYREAKKAELQEFRKWKAQQAQQGK